MTEEKVYKLLCAYSRKQMGGSIVVSSEYDYMDLAHDCYVRYLRSDWNMEYPITYLWLVVSSTLKNLHGRDKLRGYKERPQYKVKSSSHIGTVYFSDDEDEWNENFITDGPEKDYVDLEQLEEIEQYAKQLKYLTPDILRLLACGHSANSLTKRGINRKGLYNDWERVKVRFQQ